MLADFRQRVADWRLSPLPKHALVADWKRKTERRTQDHHDYRLVIDLVNKGSKLVSEWRVRVEIPREFVKVGQGNNRTIVLEEDSEKLPADERKMYPGDRKAHVLPVRYFVDQRIYDMTTPTSPIVRITVWSGDAEPWIEEIPFSKLNEF